jgi:hypothetical protein
MPSLAAARSPWWFLTYWKRVCSLAVGCICTTRLYSGKEVKAR